MVKLFKTSVVNRFLLILGAISVITFTGIAVAANYFNSTTASARIEASLLNLTQARANEMDTFLSAVARIPVDLAASVQADSAKDEAALKERMRQILIANPDIYGTAVAFEPNTFYPDQKYFSPYYWYDKGTPNYIQLGSDSYVYWEWEWYAKPRDQKKQVWTAPYYDAGAGETLMITTAAPFYHANGAFAGVTTVDVSLEKLTQIVATIGQSSDFDGQAHALLVNENDQVIAIDQPDLLVQKIEELGDTQKNKLAELNQGRLKELSDLLRADPQGVVTLADPFRAQGRVYAAHAHLPNTGWTLVILAPVAVILKGAYLATAYSVAVAVGAILLLLGVMFVVTRRTLRPIEQMVAVARQIAETDLAHLAAANTTVAQGDLTVTINVQAQPLAYQSTDEIGALAAAFNQMIARLQETGRAFELMTANLSQLVNQTSAHAHSVSAASLQLAATARQSSQAIQQITTAMHHMAQGATQQTDSLARVTGSVEQLSCAITGVAQGAQEQAESIGKASSLTSQISMAITLVSNSAQASAHSAAEATQAVTAGARTVETTSQGMAAIKEKVGLSAKKMQEMGARSGQIGAIVETIQDIASQTNLLALNAAIEAARAGEHGKGFAVVADEVRKLAEKSATATKEIGGLIKSIQTTVTEAITAMQENTTEVEEGVRRTGQAGAALANILTAVEAVNRQVEQIAAAAQQMDASAAEMVTAMESVSAVVEENTASTEEMAASSSTVTEAMSAIAGVSAENSIEVKNTNSAVDTLNAQVRETTEAAQSLANLAQNLQAVVAQFKTGQ